MQKIAVIGAGRWGRNIIRTVMPIADVRAIAYGGNTETEAFLKETYPGTPLTTDYHTVLADESIESVFIATPIPTHADIVRDALNAGKHVFVEKPLSLDSTAIDELYALAQEKNRTLFVGYIYTYDPAFFALKDALAKETNITIETIWTKYGTFDSPLSENLFVHELALVHELLGTLDVQNVARNEENVFDGTFTSVKGTAHIFIDREQQEKKKVLTVKTDTTLYTMTIGKLVAQDLVSGNEKTLNENTGAQLLEIELKNFLEETKNGSATNSKRRSVDLSTAAILVRLSSTRL